ncbi:MAG: outer membrane beta-barrel protein [Gemmatimonadota bacterium]
MSRFRIVVCAAAFAGALTAQPAAAQDHRWSLEGRLGATLPTGDIGDNDETAGLSGAVDLLYSVSNAASLYGGVRAYRFNCDGPECVDDRNGKGLGAGVKFVFAREARALPWVRGGVIYDQAAISGSDSDWAPGFEVGAGIDLDLSPRFALVPAVRYYGYRAEFAQPEDDADMRYFVIDLGAHLHF